MSDRSFIPNTASAGEALRPRGWKFICVVAGLLLTLALSALDATIVGTALPTIVGDLHRFDQYFWVVTAYLLTSTTVVPIVGKLSDQFGRKGFVLAGIALFLLGSALAGTSQTMTQLILFRGLQGLGAGCMQTLAFTVVADLFPPAERARWQGVFVSVLSLALIVGPAIGGAITDHATWRWVFYVNLPLGALALVFLGVWLPAALSVRKSVYRGWAAVRRIDFAGALTAAAATVCLLLALTWGGTTYPWASAQVVSLLVAAGVLYLAFLVVERFVREPLLPLDLFRNQVFAASVLLALAGGMVAYAMIFYLPLFMQGVLSQTATNSGASLAPMFIPLGISAVLGGQVIAKVGRYHALAVMGALILLAGLFLLTRLDPATAFWAVTLEMIVVGVGFGILQPIYTIAGQNAIPLERLGAGTGAINYLRAMGSLLGTAVLGAIVTRSATGGSSTGLSLAARQALALSIQHAFLVTFGVGVAILIITLFLKDVPLRKRGEGMPSPSARAAALPEGAAGKSSGVR
ncbi:MAG TPA: MDR family MFS transporter [Ktedonobacterales bacterium]|nr:MDR family MFS transporter [Ktedonobacterales bacterium]